MAQAEPDVLEDDDLSKADRIILTVLHDGARTKGAIVDSTGLHRNTVGNRLDVLEAGDAIRCIHESTALWELVFDPRDGTDETVGGDGDDRVAELESERDELREQVVTLQEEIADLESRPEGLPDRAVRSLHAARTALEGQSPDIDMAKAELDAVLEVIDDE